MALFYPSDEWIREQPRVNNADPSTGAGRKEEER